MQLDVYINYPGNCEEAFRFYEQHLGGRVTSIQRHSELPPRPDFPAGWSEKVLHARIEIGNAVVMGADVPGAQPMRSAYLTLRTETPERAEEIYAVLTHGGEIFMKLEETFFASRFAMLRDRFGTSWMILHERPQQGSAEQ